MPQAHVNQNILKSGLEEINAERISAEKDFRQQAIAMERELREMADVFYEKLNETAIKYERKITDREFESNREAVRVALGNIDRGREEVERQFVMVHQQIEELKVFKENQQGQKAGGAVIQSIITAVITALIIALVLGFVMK